MTTLFSEIADIFPMNAEPMWAGGPDQDSARVEWAEHSIIVTAWTDPGQYEVGIYADYANDPEPLTMAVFPHDPTAMAEIVDMLTELQPEGTDWAAWACQWLDDHNDRIVP